MTTTVATDIIAGTSLLTMIDSRPRRFLTVLFPALLLPLQLLLFGPHTIYSGNVAGIQRAVLEPRRARGSDGSLAIAAALALIGVRAAGQVLRALCRRCWWRWASRSGRRET